MGTANVGVFLLHPGWDASPSQGYPKREQPILSAKQLELVQNKKFRGSSGSRLLFSYAINSDTSITFNK